MSKAYNPSSHPCKTALNHSEDWRNARKLKYYESLQTVEGNLQNLQLNIAILDENQSYFRRIAIDPYHTFVSLDKVGLFFLKEEENDFLDAKSFEDLPSSPECCPSIHFTISSGFFLSLLYQIYESGDYSQFGDICESLLIPLISEDGPNLGKSVHLPSRCPLFLHSSYSPPPSPPSLERGAYLYVWAYLRVVKVPRPLYAPSFLLSLAIAVRSRSLVRLVEVIMGSNQQNDVTTLLPLPPILRLLDDVRYAGISSPYSPFRTSHFPQSQSHTGQLFSFGKADHGKLGNESSSLSLLVPTPVKALEGVGIKWMDSLSSHTLVVTEGGEVFMWGMADSPSSPFSRSNKTISKNKLHLVESGNTHEDEGFIL